MDSRTLGTPGRFLVLCFRLVQSHEVKVILQLCVCVCPHRRSPPGPDELLLQHRTHADGWAIGQQQEVTS